MKRIWKFTMIELLIVISIIVILAGILMPALQKAKQLSASISCLSNLKNVNISLLNYGSDYDDWTLGSHYACYGGESETTWSYVLCNNQYISEKYRGGNPLSNSILRCAAQKESVSNSYPATHIGINSSLDEVYNDLSAAHKEVWTYNKERGLIRLSSIRSASKVCSFGDARINKYGIHYVADVINTGSFPDMRHLGKSNFSFFDGHAGSLGASGIFYNSARTSSVKSPWYYTPQ